MTTKNFGSAPARRWLGSALVAGAALAGCGGGGGGGVADSTVTPAATAPDATSAAVPDGAFATTETFATYQRALTADDRAEPLQIGSLPAPTDDHAEPFMPGGI